MSYLTKFKALEESMHTSLPEKSYVMLRLDGKAFHTFTKQFRKPYDPVFAAVMNHVARALCQTISGSSFAYVQSDEITVIFSDLQSPNSQMWLNGREQKILSVAASTASAEFMQNYPIEEGPLPVFDARVHTLQDLAEVEEYVQWRRADARKNAISMAAGAVYSHKFLHSKSTEDRIELLKKTPYAELPNEFTNGRFVYPVKSQEKVTYTNRKTGEIHETFADRRRWITTAAVDSLVHEMVKLLPVKEESEVVV